jgi:hypothetical protein
MPLNDIGSFLYTDDSEVYLQQGTVVRLNDFSQHWTFDDLVVFHEMQDIIEAMEEERALEAQKPNT